MKSNIGSILVIIAVVIIMGIVGLLSSMTNFISGEKKKEEEIELSTWDTVFHPWKKDKLEYEKLANDEIIQYISSNYGINSIKNLEAEIVDVDFGIPHLEATGNVYADFKYNKKEYKVLYEVDTGECYDTLAYELYGEGYIKQIKIYFETLIPTDTKYIDVSVSYLRDGYAQAKSSLEDLIKKYDKTFKCFYNTDNYILNDYEKWCDIREKLGNASIKCKNLKALDDEFETIIKKDIIDSEFIKEELDLHEYGFEYIQYKFLEKEDLKFGWESKVIKRHINQENNKVREYSYDFEIKEIPKYNKNITEEKTNEVYIPSKVAYKITAKPGLTEYNNGTISIYIKDNFYKEDCVLYNSYYFSDGIIDETLFKNTYNTITFFNNKRNHIESNIYLFYKSE